MSWPGSAEIVADEKSAVWVHGLDVLPAVPAKACPLFGSRPKWQAVYQQLDPVRVKGRQLPVEIFEVTSLHAEALASGQRPGLSPLLSSLPPRGLPPAVEAAAAAAAAHLSRQGSAVGPAAAPPPAEGRLEALAADLTRNAQACCVEPQQAQQRGSGTLLNMGDRLMSVASTAAAPVGLMPHTPMIGARWRCSAHSLGLCGPTLYACRLTCQLHCMPRACQQGVLLHSALTTCAPLHLRRA